MGLYRERKRERERMSFGQGREEMVKTETFCNLGSGSDEGTEKTCNKRKTTNLLILIQVCLLYLNWVFMVSVDGCLFSFNF